jgi:hypothetical protein
MKFTIDDVIFEKGKYPAPITKIMAFLEKLPFGKLITSKGIVSQSGIAESALKDNSASEHLTPYRIWGIFKGRRMLLWGNPKTIEAFQKEREQVNK